MLKSAREPNHLRNCRWGRYRGKLSLHCSVVRGVSADAARVLAIEALSSRSGWSQLVVLISAKCTVSFGAVCLARILPQTVRLRCGVKILG
eukprot:1196297-Prorocentrum_minimum.AAC.13